MIIFKKMLQSWNLLMFNKGLNLPVGFLLLIIFTGFIFCMSFFMHSIKEHTSTEIIRFFLTLLLLLIINWETLFKFVTNGSPWWDIFLEGTGSVAILSVYLKVLFLSLVSILLLMNKSCLKYLSFSWLISFKKKFPCNCFYQAGEKTHATIGAQGDFSSLVLIS